MAQPALMVDRTLALLAANASGRRLLATGCALTTHNGSLRCAKAGAQAQLAAAIEALLLGRPPRCDETSPGEQPRSLLRLNLTNDRTRTLILQLFALRHAGHEPAAAGVALVLVHDLSAPALPDPQAMAQVFGLTPGELRVAHQLAAGASAQDIARSHGVAVSTVRCQIRVLFDKVGVRRQAELVATLATLPARLHPP
jgi:DNA-binding CsgD family transcriptional regulator